MSIPPLYQQVKQFLDTIDPEFIQANHQIIPGTIEPWIREIPTTFNALASCPRSLAVEIHKQLHLLKNDLLFWQVARQATTKDQRWQTIQQRLTTLKGYMQQLCDFAESAHE